MEGRNYFLGKMCHIAAGQMKGGEEGEERERERKSREGGKRTVEDKCTVKQC